jgi:hypothetical protein
LNTVDDRQRTAGRFLLTHWPAACSFTVTATQADFRSLHKLQEALGSCFAGGVVFNDGETSASLGARLYAVPLRSLWETA